MRAWDARAPGCAPGSDPAPWLNTIVTRAWRIDFARKERRRAAALPAELAAQDSSAEDLLMQSEALAASQWRSAVLATRQRRVLFMHDFMGFFTTQEIAHLDEVPYQTVRTRLQAVPAPRRFAVISKEQFSLVTRFFLRRPMLLGRRGVRGLPARRPDCGDSDASHRAISEGRTAGSHRQRIVHRSECHERRKRRDEANRWRKPSTASRGFAT